MGFDVERGRGGCPQCLPPNQGRSRGTTGWPNQGRYFLPEAEFLKFTKVAM